MPKTSAVFIGLALWAAVGCGAPQSTLHQLAAPSGSGTIDFQVENRTSAVINNLYLAKTSAVRAAPRKAFEIGSAEQQQLWGDDQLVGAALGEGGKARVVIPGPGRYDFRIVDRDGREQHVAGLQIQAGGRYVLELNDGGWRRPN